MSASQDPSSARPRRRSFLRPRILAALGIFLILVLVLILRLSASSANTRVPRFVPGPPPTINFYTANHYEWLGDIPSLDGKVWIWTSGRTNFHRYLYDLDHGAV
ncbi:MAG: hypothetical protein JWR69_2713, partial [Pedosphaera sp.]|nr:hypothetical protein [Pedosphaera sp.]